MLGQLEDPSAATQLDWSGLLLRSFLMEAGLSIVEMENPYMGYYLEPPVVAATASPEEMEPSGALMFAERQQAEAAAHESSEVIELLQRVDSNPPYHDRIQRQDYAVMDLNMGPRMDPRLWSTLPDRLRERVLACLPLASFFRLRLVCRRWYNLLFSDSFLELCSRVSPLRPWFLVVRQGEWSDAFLFDPLARAWLKLNLACLLPPGFSIAASSGGLLCCISEARGCKTLLICNPLTRACAELPQALKERFVPTVGLTVEPSSRLYRVLLAGDDLISPFAVKNLTTEFYDSRLQQWRVTAPLPRLCNLESGKTVYAGGFFYCMNYSPFSVLVYDAELGMWSKIQAPMRRFLRTPNLVECRGRLLLVAAVEKNKLNVPKSIRVWGVQQSRASWIELERMPNALYEEFMRVSGQKAFHCIGHGNHILITLPQSPEMVLYDFYEKVWSWAPRCPFQNQSDSCPDVGGGFMAFPFDPRLEASVC